MNVLESLLLVLHLLTAVAVCAFVLLQHGKGADMGAAFGSGASGSLFGASGSANFLSRTTAILAAVFFVTSLGLTWFAASHGSARSAIESGVMDKVPAPKAGELPTPPAGGAPGAPAAPTEAGKAPAVPAAPAAAPAAPAAGGSESKSGEVPK
jgi:preprotein translocase subunit SecG